MNFNVGFKTDIGRKRAENQDHGIALPELGLFLVADGMGGHKGGETASSTCVSVVSHYVKEVMRFGTWQSKTLIEDAMHMANQVIHEKAQMNPKLQGMGTTATGLLFQGDQVSIGHVGDSRCYFCRPGAIWQATRDHSLVQEKLKAGLITRAELKTDRMRNVIVRSVGFEEEVDVEIYTMKVKAGDCFLLCSDGLSGLVEDTEMIKILQPLLFSENNFQKAAEALVQAANGHGGDDNITVLLAQVL